MIGYFLEGLRFRYGHVHDGLILYPNMSERITRAERCRVQPKGRGCSRWLYRDLAQREDERKYGIGIRSNSDCTGLVGDLCNSNTLPAFIDGVRHAEVLWSYMLSRKDWIAKVTEHDAEMPVAISWSRRGRFDLPGVGEEISRWRRWRRE